MESGAEFTAVDFPQANRFTVHIMAAVAEHEAAMISARTKAALTAAKARGVKLGGDRGNIRSIAAAGRRVAALKRTAKADARAADVAPVILDLKAAGVSLRGIATALDERGIPPPRGGAWGVTQIKRVLARAA
jgi:DNA invertase Pin-like site-specific DNA recombinase